MPMQAAPAPAPNAESLIGQADSSSHANTARENRVDFPASEPLSARTAAGEAFLEVVSTRSERVSAVVLDLQSRLSSDGRAPQSY